MNDDVLLPLDATDSQIKNLIIEWSELLADEKYEEALDFFPHSKEEIEWTPKELKNWISFYGSPDPVDDERFKITSLKNRDDFEDIIEESIEVNRYDLYELDPEDYIGMVHYHDVPLNGELSDLTARFHIMKVGKNKLTLEFLDIHVL